MRRAGDKRRHDEEARKAMRLKLPPGADKARAMVEKDGGAAVAAEATMEKLADADDACVHRRFGEAESIYRALASSPDRSPVAVARLHVRRASCRRRALDAPSALKALDDALSAVPLFAPALFERGLALLDAGRPVEAVDALATLASVDPTYPLLRRWLTHAHARARHRGQGPIDGPIEEGWVYGARVRTVAE
jgi:predicted Zn-dependent protease